MRTLVLILSLSAVGCESSPSNPDPGSASADASCTRLSDCGEGLVCLSIGESPGTCQPTCSVSADECGGSAECGGVGAVSVDVCQPPDSIADPEDPPQEEDRSSLPCVSDEECDALEPGLVCGTWRGWKECTLPCVSADTCNPPTIAGFTTSFLTCDPDEGDTSRDICVPDEACFANPLTCVEFDF